MAFDHRQIVEYAHLRIRHKLDYTNAGFELLPGKFTLTGLQSVPEAILGESIEGRNFRRKIVQPGSGHTAAHGHPTEDPLIGRSG